MKLYPDDWRLVARKVGLSEQDIALLALFSGTAGSLRTSEARARLEAPLSRQYLVRHLSALVDKGMLVQSGNGPQTRYAINERHVAATYLRTDPLLRAGKPFDIALIRDYEPNQTRLMSLMMAEELRAVSDAAIKAGNTINRIVFRRYMIDFAWASSKLEGNTYSLLETQSLLMDGTAASNRSVGETQMLKNHAAAIEYVIDNARDLHITPVELRGLHALLSRGLLPTPDDEGRIRQSMVQIGQSVYRPSAVAQVLEEGLCLIAEKASAITDPYEQSLFLLVQISYLQPFIDANKRIARVASNIPLLKAGLCPLSFYGMADDDYINGLLAYYEINTAVPIADAYRQGYRAAAERYRAYGTHLSDRLDAIDEQQRQQTTVLVMQYLRAVVAGESGPDEKDRFLRTRIVESDPVRRDTLLATTSKTIDRLSEIEVIGMGISKALFDSYRDALSFYGNDLPGPR